MSLEDIFPQQVEDAKALRFNAPKKREADFEARLTKKLLKRCTGCNHLNSNHALASKVRMTFGRCQVDGCECKGN
jgi:hypothetical protein